MSTHAEHRVVDRQPGCLIVEITSEERNRVTVTEYAVRACGFSPEAYSLEKPEGEAYAAPRADAIRYVCTVPAHGKVTCTCWGFTRWQSCKHSITIEWLRDVGELGQETPAALVARIEHQEWEEIFV